jgi:predicted AlkP superfamily pyrophosphatase or phosphodiesterase
MGAEPLRMLIVQAAALGYEFASRYAGVELAGMKMRPTNAVFPAVTCVAQASFRTGRAPSSHGMVANGRYSRELARPFFWEQSSALVAGERIWDEARRSGLSVGNLFWQQSLGRDADVLLSPAPIHKHHGGMIQDCYSKPAGLYGELVDSLGRFALSSYWGPMSSAKSSRWIVKATAEVCRRRAADVVFTYLPHLDYELQKSGPDSKGAAREFAAFNEMLQELAGAARASGYRLVVWGDYAIVPVSRAVLPNRALKDAGLFSTRTVGRMTYPDIYSSRAFAMTDHQIAHVYVPNANDLAEAKSVLERLDGVARVLAADEKRNAGVDHENAGELVIESERDAWFAYHWWTDSREEPDYARHIDIHSKPGYDPCELFWGLWPFSVSTDTSRVKGSHGLVGKGLEVAWASDIDFGREPESLLDLSQMIGARLTEGSLD